jgi:hypothetical protein
MHAQQGVGRRKEEKGDFSDQLGRLSLSSFVFGGDSQQGVGRRKEEEGTKRFRTEEIFHQRAIESLENLGFNWVLLFFSL